MAEQHRGQVYQKPHFSQMTREMGHPPVFTSFTAAEILEDDLRAELQTAAADAVGNDVGSAESAVGAAVRVEGQTAETLAGGDWR